MGSAPGMGTLGVPGSPPAHLGGEEGIWSPQTKAVMGKAMPRAAPATRASNKDLAGRFACFPWMKRGGWGGFPGRSPRCWRGAEAVSL